MTNYEYVMRMSKDEVATWIANTIINIKNIIADDDESVHAIGNIELTSKDMKDKPFQWWADICNNLMNETCIDEIRCMNTLFEKMGPEKAELFGQKNFIYYIPAGYPLVACNAEGNESRYYSEKYLCEVSFETLKSELTEL